MQRGNTPLSVQIGHKMRWPIERQIRVAFVIALMLFIGICASTYRSTAALREATRAMAGAYGVTIGCETVLTRLLDVEMRQRDYLLTGGDHLLQPYREGVKSVDQALNQLRQFSLNNPNQQWPFEALQSLVDQRVGYAGQSVATRHRQGHDAALQMVVTERETALMHEIRQAIAGIKSEESLKIDGYQQAAELNLRDTQNILMLGNLLAVVLVALAVFSIEEELAGRQRAEGALKEANRRKDEFLAMLAHELRNPLAPIRYAVQVLQLTGSREPTLQWCRDVIDRQVQHMVRLVDDLLDVSRITRGRITLQKEPLDLATIVAGAVETSRPLIDEHNHELVISVPPEPVRVEGDLTRLSQVISTLLSNAAKYTDNGGRIWLTAERSGSEAIVRVRDAGTGITADVVPYVFDLFFQADRSLDRSPGGLGVGLSIVRSLVEMHGGRVEAFSEGRGRGSEFVVRLPVSQA